MEELEWGDHLIVGDSTKVGATKKRARRKSDGTSSKAPAAKRPRRDLAQPVHKPVRPPKAD
eukprot:100343-Alexandrium_andersonii.AAC.1